MVENDCPGCFSVNCMDHGRCTKCTAYCGCSFAPTSSSDYCDAHRNLVPPPSAARAPEAGRDAEPISVADVQRAMEFYRRWNGYRVADLMHAVLAADRAALRARRDERSGAVLAAIDVACDIIEEGDRRLLAHDGPIGDQPPRLTLAEWRTLYVTLDRARSGQGGGDG